LVSDHVTAPEAKANPLVTMIERQFDDWGQQQLQQLGSEYEKQAATDYPESTYSDPNYLLTPII